MLEKKKIGPAALKSHGETQVPKILGLKIINNKSEKFCSTNSPSLGDNL